MVKNIEMEITLNNKISLFDLAVLITGSPTKAFDIAIENDLEMDAILNEGDIISYSGDVINQKVVDYFKTNGIIPNSLLNDEEAHEQIFSFQFSEIFA